MTKERAIQLAREWSMGLVCSLCEGEAEEYHKMFLEMLCSESEPRESMRYGKWKLLYESPFGAPHPVRLWACSECGAKMTIKE